MKLIDKDTLVGEIERRISTYKRHYEELVRYEVWNDAKKIEPKINELENLLSFINTLEMKEVNLEKEVHKFIDKEELHLRLWDVDRIAKHFFELGLAQKGE